MRLYTVGKLVLQELSQGEQECVFDAQATGETDDRHTT